MPYSKPYPFPVKVTETRLRAEQGQQHASRHGGTDNTGHVGAHSVHQQEVGRILLLAHGLGYTSRHGNSGHTSGTDQGVDLLLGEHVHQLGKEHAASGAETKGHNTHSQDGQSLHAQEGSSGSGSTHGSAQEDGDDVHQLVLHGLAETVGDAALLGQIAEHQAGDQRRGGGNQQRHKDGDHDGEDDLLGLGHNGHIGFNEPGAAFEKETHCVDLTESTIEANKRFFESEDDVPRQAYTMGIKNIMQAKKILLVVSGEDKADILKEVLYGPITPKVPASILQLHNDVTIVADEAALSKIDM